MPFLKGKVCLVSNNQITVTVEKKKGVGVMFRISYVNEEGTHLYRVKLHVIDQTIVLSRGMLVHKIGMDPRCLVGCKDLSVHEIIDLGFVFPADVRRMVI